MSNSAEEKEAPALDTVANGDLFAGEEVEPEHDLDPTLFDEEEDD